MGRSSQTDVMRQQRNCPVRFGRIKKNVKPQILTQKSNNSNFRKKLWLVYVCYGICNVKKKINLNFHFVNFG